MKNVSSIFDNRTSRPTEGVRGRHEQAVIAAGIQTDDRRQSKTTEPVRLQPLVAKSRFQVAACFPFELNHICSLNRESRAAIPLGCTLLLKVMEISGQPIPLHCDYPEVET